MLTARTLYLVVTLNVIAGSIFDLVDSSRYAPCVLVFFAIALGATAYSGWTARRKGVDVRAPRATDRAQLAVSSLVSGVILYAIIRFLAEGHNHHSWLAAAVAVGFGAGTRFPEDWRRAPRGKGRAEMLGWSVGSAVSSLISGAIFYGIAWYLAESFGHESTVDVHFVRRGAVPSGRPQQRRPGEFPTRAGRRRRHGCLCLVSAGCP